MNIRAINTTQTETTVDLSMLKEYEQISSIEKELKKRKDEIKNYYKSYLEGNGLTETEEFDNLLGTLEERTSYSLSAEILQDQLPSWVFDEILEKKIDLNKAKAKFLEGQIPIELLLQAESKEDKSSFYVRKANSRSGKSNKSVPFWRVSVD